MILLDTNVVSEVMRPQPSEKVLHWLNQQDASALFLSSITIAEFVTDCAFCRSGNVGKYLRNALSNLLLKVFRGVLSYLMNQQHVSMLKLWVGVKKKVAP